MEPSIHSSDKSRVLCRYFMQGCCRYKNGECPFAHDLSIAPSQVCKYYLAGCCVYGAKCRYDHVRPEWTKRDSSHNRPGRASDIPPAGTQDACGSGQEPSSSSTGADAPASQATASGSGTSSRSTHTPAWQVPTETLQRLQLEQGEDAVADTWEDADAILQRLPQSLISGDGDQPRVEGQLAACLEHEEQHEQGLGQALGSGQQEEQYDGQFEYGQGEFEAQYNEGEYGQQYYEQYNDGEDGGGDGGERGGEGRPWWSSEEVDASQHPEAGDGVDADLEPSQRPLCGTFSAYGTCPHGDSCRYVHGHVCEVCHRRVIHPYNAAEAEQHQTECTARHERLAARIRSTEVECGICLEKVLSAPNPADRRFGILTGCDHAFCLKCIRAWRTTGAGDLETAVRACPVCRATSHYIAPSLVWPANSEDKERIIAGYKSKLATIDCTHFQRGEGKCPFGTSCFYRHMFKDGTLQSREPFLRLARDDEGDVHVLQTHRLSDFLVAAGLMPPSRRRRPVL